MDRTIRIALLTILSTLPEGAEISFYWRDGDQHMSMKLPGEDRAVASYRMGDDGKGVVIPTMIH